MPKKRAVIILGMHRSGTSVVSRFINMLGFDLGEHLMAPRKDNPKGFWENEEIVRHNEELMASTSVRWDSLELDMSLVLKKGLAKKSQTAALRVLKREFSANQIVIKDPRICRLYPVWQKVLWEAKFSIVPVIVYRDPGSVARSLEKRDMMPLYRGLLLWLIYTLEATQYAKRSPIFINYDELVRDPKLGLAPLERLNRKDYLAVRDQFIKNFLSKKLYHHKKRSAKNGLEKLTQTVAENLLKEDMSSIRQDILPALVATYADSESPAEFKRLYEEVSSTKAHSANLEIERKSYNRQVKLLKSAFIKKDKYAASMQEVLEEKTITLVKVKQYLKEKTKAHEDYVQSLSASLEGKIAELVASKKYIADKVKISDEYITSLSSSLEEKENYISELSSSLEEQENYITQLESTTLVGVAKKLHGIRRERDA